MAEFMVTPRVFVGENALEEALPALRGFGQKALVVTGKHVGKSFVMDLLAKGLDQAGIAYSVFDGITGEPTDVMIKAGVEAFKETKADFLIGLGGGSPLDSAKAISAMSVLPGKISEYNGKEIVGDFPKVAAIPTTSGTGSEATKFTVITDTENDVKMLLKGAVLLPDLAVLCPTFMKDMPKGVTACTGLDALTHAVEAYTSRKASPLTDVYAVDAVKRILAYLPTAYQGAGEGTDEVLAARQQMMIAAFEAGVCINNSSVTIVHGMSRPIGALFHVAHGMSNAMLIDTCLRWAMDGAYDRFGGLGKAVGAAPADASDEEAANALMEKVAELVKVCEIPTLREFGVKPEEFSPVIAKMSHDAVASGSPANCWKPVTEADCAALYEKIYG